MIEHPSTKYAAFRPVPLTDRRWPGHVITKAPVWMSTDLRDGTPTLPLLLPGTMASIETTGCRAEHAVMAGIVAGDAADSGVVNADIRIDDVLDATLNLVRSPRASVTD